jgi:hypothetical protein
MTVHTSASLLLLTLLTCIAQAESVRDRGARGDGAANDTHAVQAAIDTVARRGGGEVLFPPGRYLCGTVRLKSHVSLHLQAGAALVMHHDDKQFDEYESLPFNTVDDLETTYFHHALLAADGVRDVAIYGQGVIDANRTKRGGPKPVALKNTEHISIRGITIRNAPNYAISLLGCSDVDIDGVKILNGYCDGIDPDCSRFVRIANCYIDTYDDAICLKTSQALGKPAPTEHVTVTNCILRTNCSNFKMGTESRGDFRNIALSNCVMLRRDAGRPPEAGVAIESVDGAHIDSVVVSNISMQGVATPLFIRLGNRGRGMKPPTPGSLRNVSISGIVASGIALASSITGLTSALVQDISLSDLSLATIGGGLPASLDVPEVPEKYPSPGMFGPLPASGLYARHVERLILRNVRTSLDSTERRPAMLFDDVRDLHLQGFHFVAPIGPQPALWLHRVAGALISGCRSSREMELFMRISGRETRRVSLIGNDLLSVREAFAVNGGADRSAISLSGNVLPAKPSHID